jgi:uncharacterized protein (TIGR03086 family)
MDEEVPMSDLAERFRKVASGFTERVEAVPDGAWRNPAPCEGWVARDVVRHLVEWVPAFLRGYAEVEIARGPSVDDDPCAAWATLRDGLQATLDDADTASREFDSPAGRMAVEQALDMLVTNDVLVHTWDLARATGLDETLDPDEVHRVMAAAEPYDEALRSSGHYGPRVRVPDDADEQTRLIAFMGRQP